MARICGFMENHYYAVEAEVGYAQQRRLVEAARMASPPARLDRVVTIPVVVHVVAHPDQDEVTDAQIQRQIDVLNADFRARNDDRDNVPDVFKPLVADAGIEFRLATRDPLGRPTTGINRVATGLTRFPSIDVPETRWVAQIDAEVKMAGTGAAAWPRNEYLNLWVCNMRRNPLGYAAFPGSAAWRDGVVIDFTCFGVGGTARPDFDLGRTAVHEVGHWLDLLHIWGDDDRHPNVCALSDNVADTPNQGGPNGSKPPFPTVSCNNAPNGDLFMNYMDYVDDDAMFMFTANQVDRMQAALQGPRRSLLVSRGLEAPDAARRVDAAELLAAGAAAALEPGGPEAQLVFDGVDWVPAAEVVAPI